MIQKILIVMTGFCGFVGGFITVGSYVRTVSKWKKDEYLGSDFLQ